MGFVFVVPPRRYADLAPTFRDLNFDEDGVAEGIFANHSLIVTHDPLCAKEQTERRRSHIPELEDIAIKMVARLDAKDEGKTLRGCRASDRRAHSRFPVPSPKRISRS